MALTIGTRLGSHEITALLGKGGMGEVYRARDLNLKREVAIKILPEEFSRDADRVSRFQREAEVLASLNHPNIASIYDLEETDGTRYLVLELVEGEALAERIARGPIPVKEALNIAIQICEALEAAHERGIIHRDLKPANVKVTADDRVKVLDFGLAKAMNSTPGSRTLSNAPTFSLSATQAGVILGTAAYMSPEQASGKLTDHRSDIWSFGAVLYELLSGKQAFPGESISDTLASVLKIEPDWNALPASTPASIRKLLERCLTKNHKQRLQAIGEARITIEQQLSNSESKTDAQPPTSRSAKLPWILALAATAAAFIVSYVHFRETQPHPSVFRYMMATPENGSVTEFVISPDGRYVVFSARVKEKQQLWLQALDALDAQPISGTEDGFLPFWSPDSLNIGFFTVDRIKKVPVGGGAVQTVCPVEGGTGGSWNRDDVILFSSTGTGESLQTVTAKGGVPVVVALPNARARQPTFLPDGRRFLYTMRTGAPRALGVYRASIDGGESQLVLEAASNALFAPTISGGRQGHLLFVRDDSLKAVPFDSANAKITGDEFTVAEGVSINPRGPYTPLTVSDSGVLMFWNNADHDSHQISWFDRGGKSLGSMGGTGQSFPSLSPDGKTLAFVRPERTGSNIWLWDLARGTDTRLTSDTSRNVDPVWSPLGDRIAFRSDRQNSAGNLYERPTNGSGQDQLLVQTGTNKIPSQWSRDGLIVYSESDRNRNLDIWVLSVAENGQAREKPVPFLQTEFSESQGQLSPDGQWMAYSSNESGSQREVFVRRFPSADRKIKISTAGGVQPRWSGDSKELFFITLDGQMTAVPVKALAGPKPSFEIGTPARLFPVRVDITGLAVRYDVSLDGKTFFVETIGASSPARLTVWANWLEGFKK